ncbi:MAG: peptidylprolyl isomerase [Bacteroidales bacterium]|nr:peptidylprolyl isomerase [Bacteroidales bacterium]
MKIGKNKVVGFHYTLTDGENNIIDSSSSREPLTYLHGHHGIIPGLEAELEGKAVNDEFKVSIQPEKAYGAYNNDLVFEVNRSNFSDPESIEVGIQVQGQMAEGEPPTLLTVIEVHDDVIVLDGNHPMAGQTLNFDVKVVEIRDASAEEIDHGHVHGAHGHHH